MRALIKARIKLSTLTSTSSATHRLMFPEPLGSGIFWQVVPDNIRKKGKIKWVTYKVVIDGSDSKHLPSQQKSFIVPNWHSSSGPSKHWSVGQSEALATHVNGSAPDPGISLQHIGGLESSPQVIGSFAIVQVLEEAGPGWQRWIAGVQIKIGSLPTPLSLRQQYGLFSFRSMQSAPLLSGSHASQSVPPSSVPQVVVVVVEVV